MQICPMSQCPMSQISLPVLSLRCGVSRRNLQRMAADGLIPGASRTAGGHWRIKDSHALDGWIKSRNFEKISRVALGRGRAGPVQNAVFQLGQRLNTAIEFVNDAGREWPKGSDFLEVMSMEKQLLAIRGRIDEALGVFGEYKEWTYRAHKMNEAEAGAQSSGLNG
jgi:hypothetical protein